MVKTSLKPWWADLDDATIQDLDRLKTDATNLLNALEAVTGWAREQRIGIPVRCGHVEAIARAESR